MTNYKWQTTLGQLECTRYTPNDKDPHAYYMLRGFDKDLYKANQEIQELKQTITNLEDKHKEELMDLKIKYLESLLKYDFAEKFKDRL